MRIGIVTTWFERGAAYVSEIYMRALENEGHDVYIYARGGESHPSKKNVKWNRSKVTRCDKYLDSKIDCSHFFKWIRDNKLDAILFNEQKEYSVVYKTKVKFPKIKIGAYVDYYTEDTLKFFGFFDFLICNTYRHMQAMKNHPQKYYIKWGTNIDLFKPVQSDNENIVFFHSVGMSLRKGTDILVDAFIEGNLYKKSKLLIHTQLPIDRVCKYNKQQLIKYGIEIIEETVPAPGLYYMGDVYIYPTRLDGLGLTMYEAIASGLPMITTDFPPMNEVGDDSCVRLVKTSDFYCRNDAFYYPMALCDKKSLIENMQWFINNREKLPQIKSQARQYAVNNYDINKKSKEISDVFNMAKVNKPNDVLYKQYKRWALTKGNFIASLLNLVIINQIINKLKRIK